MIVWNWKPIAVVAACMALVALTVFAIDAVHDKKDYAAAIGAVATMISLAVTFITYRALGLAKVSADAAKEAANAALAGSEGLKRIERAYISISWEDPKWENNLGNLQLSASNLGKTPGIVRRVYTSVEERTDGVVPNVDDFFKKPIRCALAVKPGHGEIFRFLEVDRRKTYTILCVIEYEDIFGNENRTTICCNVNWEDNTSAYYNGSGWNHMS